MKTTIEYLKYIGKFVSVPGSKEEQILAKLISALNNLEVQMEEGMDAKDVIRELDNLC